MRKQVTLPTDMSMRDFDRRADQILQELQKILLPEHASEVVAINVETGEYVLAATADEASDTFHERWPDQLAFVVRVDGGPVVKFHGK
jgi:hypothetical protein